MNGARALRRLLRAEWERSLAWTLATGAALALFLGYHNLAASPFAAEEIAHLITGGIGALLLLVAAVGLLLSADLRDESDKLDRIDARLGRPFADPCDRSAARFVGAAVSLVGVVILAAGWARAAGTADFDRSLTGLALAIIGFAVVTVAVAARSRAARRTVRRRIAGLVRAGVLNGERAGGDLATVDGREWTAERLSRSHLRSCPALASAAAATVQVVEGSAAGLEPCLICHAEG